MPEFYEAYAANRALKCAVLPGSETPYAFSECRSGGKVPIVGLSLFAAPPNPGSVENWKSNFARNLSVADLKQNLVLNRGSVKGKDFWNAYVVPAVRLAKEFPVALAISPNIWDAIVAEFPQTATLYRCAESPAMIGHGATMRYLMSQYHSLIYLDIDPPFERNMRWYRMIDEFVGTFDPGMVRTTTGRKVDSFYRGVLGSRVFIEKIDEFDVESAVTGHTIANLAHQNAATTFVCEDPSLPGSKWGEIWPCYCYDEYLLHTLFMPHFARKGRLHTAVFGNGDDPRYIADIDYVKRFAGNTFSLFK